MLFSKTFQWQPAEYASRFARNQADKLSSIEMNLFLRFDVIQSAWAEFNRDCNRI